MKMQIPLKRKPVIILILAGVLLLVALFWYLGTTGNIYGNAAVGALFEILWLPAIFLTLALPIVSIYFWYRDGLRVQSVFLYIGLLAIIGIIILLKN